MPTKTAEVLRLVEQLQQQQFHTGEATSLTQHFLDTTRAMNTVYLLLVIGVVWKFIRHMKESRSSKVDEIS
jgi:hypothetical protein